MSRIWRWLVLMALLGAIFSSRSTLSLRATIAWKPCVGVTNSRPRVAAFFRKCSIPYWHATVSSRGSDGGYWGLLAILTASATANSTVPVPAGIPLRIWLQKRWLNIPVGSSIAATTLESLLGYGLLGLSAVLASIVWLPRQIFSTCANRPWLIPLVGMVAIVLIMLLRLAWKRHPQAGRLLNAWRQEKHLRYRPIWISAALVLSGIALAFLRLLLVCFSLDGPPLIWGLVFTGLVVSRIAGVASMVPMGLGARDLSLGYFLVLAGASPLTAVSWAVLDRLVMSLPYLGAGLVSLKLVHRLPLPDAPTQAEALDKAH